MARLRGQSLTFHSTWGLFSPTQVDDGSRLLIEHLTVQPDGVALDIGCGYGAIGLLLAKLAPQGVVHMVDKDFVAVEYAQKNAELNGLRNCEVYLSNGLSHVSEIRFDAIVSNLPAKTGRELFDILLFDAQAHLKPGGTFSVVTIAGLKEFIKRNLREVFGNYKKLGQHKGYIVAVAVKR
ncbi:class I SAM-dependent methyltransferase [Candidatus Parcubacteria bacterium]|nr:class I SAM-dependent methyltransferase [Candidatus Parcubacteria bacterium]